MVFIAYRRIRDKLWPESLPPRGIFDGQSVLITGATGGLGLAATKHFVALGATVIMTSRTLSQGLAARQQIEEDMGHETKGKIRVMELDMSLYASCVSFVNALRESDVCRRGLDCAVLNAGVISADFIESKQGWEQTIQVNTLSTTLLGLLLLDLMKKTHQPTRPTPHIVFVASRDHLDPDVKEWTEWGNNGGILRHLSNKENWPTGQVDPNYAASKLMLMYAIEVLCQKAVNEEKEIQVIINTVCPGLVSTDIARSITKKSTLMRLVVPVYLGVLGKSANYGARFYVSAALEPKANHGKNIQCLFSDEEYQKLAYDNMKSETAQEVKGMVLNEIWEELKKNVPNIHGLLSK